MFRIGTVVLAPVSGFSAIQFSEHGDGSGDELVRIVELVPQRVADFLGGHLSEARRGHRSWRTGDASSDATEFSAGFLDIYTARWWRLEVVVVKQLSLM